jgi:7-cyano-7-deazaguanine synthase
MKALVVLSGGTDSAVALDMALGRHKREDIITVSFDYGQKMIRELKSAAQVATAKGVSWSVVMLSRQLFTGVMVRNGEAIPTGKLRELKPQGTSPVEVPFRNGIFLSSAVAYAIEHDCTEVWHGIHAEDGTEWAYPDNSPEFLGAMAAAIWIGSAHRVRLVSPFEWMTKANVIAVGLELDTPFSLTYSCYTGQYPSCGECIACEARLEAFSACGVTDPILYIARPTTLVRKE